MSRKATSDRLTDREFIQLCAEWPYAQLPLEAQLRLSLIAALDRPDIERSALMLVRPTAILHALYGAVPAGQVTT